MPVHDGSGQNRQTGPDSELCLVVEASFISLYDLQHPDNIQRRTATVFGMAEATSGPTQWRVSVSKAKQPTAAAANTPW